MIDRLPGRLPGALCNRRAGSTNLPAAPVRGDHAIRLGVIPHADGTRSRYHTRSGNSHAHRHPMSHPPRHRLPVLLSLLCGLILRVVTPAGYMPASAGSGLLFELCPDSLPPGVTLAGASVKHQAHHHHGDHGDHGDKGDQCDLGHMLSGASADAPAVESTIAVPPAPISETASAPLPAAAPRRNYLPRAPPFP